MSTFISTAVAAIMAALTSGTPVASQVARVRLRPLAAAQAQAVVVRPLSSEVSETALIPSLPVSWASAIAVECYARSNVGVAPDDAVDTLLAAVYARLMADTTLGGAVIAVQPQSINFDFDADGDQTTCATLVFNVRHRSPGATL